MDDITSILIQKSDRELRDEIEAATKPLDTLLRNGACDVSIVAKRGANRYDAGQEVDTGCAWHELLQALREDAFRKHFENRRKLKIAEFMSAVDRLQGQLDELRASASE